MNDVTLRTQIKLLQNELDAVRRQAQQGLTASAMWASIVHTPPHAQTAPAKTCIAAIGLVAKVSGIFHVDLDVAWSDGTAADLVTWELVTLQAAPTTALTGGISAGVRGSGNTFLTGGSQILAVDAAGGNGLLYNGAPINDTTGVTQFSAPMATVAGLLTANGAGSQCFGAHGLVQSTSDTTVKAPFALSTPSATLPVIFGIAVTAAHVVTIADLALTVSEYPIA